MVPIELLLVLALLTAGFLGIMGLLVIYVARGVRLMGKTAEMLNAFAQWHQETSAPS